MKKTKPLKNWVQQLQQVQKSQDSKAFAELFDYFAPRVKSFLIRSGASNSMAEDCAQEVMATVWLKAHLFDPSRASVSTWIFTIARNKNIDALRKQRRPEPEDLTWGPESEPEAADILTLQQETEQLRLAMSRPPKFAHRGPLCSTTWLKCTCTCPSAHTQRATPWPRHMPSAVSAQAVTRRGRAHCCWPTP